MAAGDYTINFTDSSIKAPLTVVKDTVNSSLTSLTLVGKLEAPWGITLQQSFIQLLENFRTKGIAPSHPTYGQVWYNANDGQLRACRDVSVFVPPGGYQNQPGWQRYANIFIMTADPLTLSIPMHNGAFWYKTDTGVLYIYNSIRAPGSQWIQLNWM